MSEQTQGEQQDTQREEPARCCVTCGAVITEGTTAMHNRWHDRLNDRMNAADSGIGFSFGGGSKRL